MTFINKIYSKLIKGNNNTLNNGIWELIESYKTVEIDLTTASNYYKEYNNILQTINVFENIDAFCISYKLLEGCNL